MRRSSLANAQFKPPKLMNLSTSSANESDQQDSRTNEKCPTQTELKVEEVLDRSYSNCQNAKVVISPENHSCTTDNNSVETDDESQISPDYPSSVGAVSIESQHEVLSNSQTSSEPSTSEISSPTPTYSTNLENTCMSGFKSTPFRLGFKNPSLKNPDSNSNCKSSSQAVTIEQLEIQKQELEAEIKRLEDDGHREEELEEYVTALHKYNNMKDIAQCVMGRLAVRRGITVREIAGIYGAPVEND